MKSLYTKFMVMFLGILLISFMVMLLSLNRMLTHYFIDQKYEQLNTHAKSIQEGYLQEQLFSGLSTVDISEELNNLERYFGATIWIVGQHGYVYVASEAHDHDLIKSELDIHEIEAIFQGKTIRRQGNYSSVSNEPVITLGYPIQDIYGDVIFALYIHVPVPEIIAANQGMFGIAYSVLGMMVVLTVGLLFLFTRFLIRDIKSLNDTVEAIAGGDYGRRTVLKRKDEIGQLAVSTNAMANALSDHEQFRRQFITDISHDFRSPLTNIIGYAEGMLDGTLAQEEWSRYVRIVGDESRRLLRLSDSILSLSELKQHQLKWTPITLEGMLLQILDSQERTIEDKEIQIDLKLPKTQVKALGDEVLIYRVMHNLIENAIKFSKAGDHIMLEISHDHAIAFCIKNHLHHTIDLEKMWHRFTKGDASRHEVEDSFGLGLSIVYEILQAHDSRPHAEIEGNQLVISFYLKKANRS